MNTGREKLNMQMLNDGHEGPNNGPNQQAWINAQASQWAAIDKQLEDCETSSSIVTTAKNTPVQEVPIANNSRDANRRPWRVLEYNLLTELVNESQRNKIHMSVRIRYREFGDGVIKAGQTNAGAPCTTGTRPANCEYPADKGYEFSDPSARILSVPLREQNTLSIK